MEMPSPTACAKNVCQYSLHSDVANTLVGRRIRASALKDKASTSETHKKVKPTEPVIISALK